MQGRNVVEKFEKTRRQQRDAMKNDNYKDRGRKRNKTQRGNDRWEEVESEIN